MFCKNNIQNHIANIIIYTHTEKQIVHGQYCFSSLLDNVGQIVYNTIRRLKYAKICDGATIIFQQHW